jgi:retron-type reverse transcriptase
MIFDQPPKSRQDLYDRIRATSKDAVVLEEMIRHGFWPERGTIPQDPAEELHRKAELLKRLSELRAELTLQKDEAKLRAELRRKRMEQSKRKQAETKERREKVRRERAARFQERKAKEIAFLGEGVSAGLGRHVGNEELLAKRGLPLLHNASELATATGFSIGQLRFLAYARKVSRVSHYKSFKIKKKTGGERAISAPMPRLKQLQRWLLEKVLDKVTLHAAAHGFRHERSIVTNAQRHVGSPIVVNLDLKDFFPSIRYPRVKGMFRWLGYSEEIATIFALVSTAPEVEEVELDGTRWFVATSERRLPQGAPTSPAITNVLCDRLDRRITSAATKLGFTYTRYADDLTFSTPSKDADVGKLLRRVKWLVTKDGLEVHPKKTRVLRKGRRQEVTGLTVNARANVPRETLRRFRAVLFQIDKDGPKGKKWGRSQDVLASIDGFANFVLMVDREKGGKLKAKVEAIHKKYGYVKPVRAPKPKPLPPATPPAAPPTLRAAEAPPRVEPPSETSPRPEPPKPPETRPWWKFW